MQQGENPVNCEFWDAVVAGQGPDRHKEGWALVLVNPSCGLLRLSSLGHVPMAPRM